VGRDFAAWIGSCRGKIRPAASGSSGRSQSKAIAICDAFSSLVPTRSCAMPSRTLKGIPGSRNSWRDDPSRSWRGARQQDGAHGLGAAGPRGHLPGASACGSGVSQGPGEGRMRLRMCVDDCRDDDDVDAKRSRPSIGKPETGPREERTRAVDWDRSADHIRASGHSGCIARRQASKRKQAGYMAAPERFAE
jgi:hypothetical protein